MADGDISRRRGLAIIAVACVLAAVLCWQLAVPLRERISARFVSRGDSYMQSLDFINAAEEYKKALRYVPDNEVAAERERQAKISLTDIAQAKSFFEVFQVTSVLGKLAEAEGPFYYPKDALTEGVKLFVGKEYVFAQYPLQRAVALDPEYPEAWHYLAQTYQKLGEIDPAYRAKAVEAFRRRDTLTPLYMNLK
jgi:Tfp pilus assembly protein PilF